MSDRENELKDAIREAARSAFVSITESHPGESFYAFGLVTTSDGLRPAPTCASEEGLERVVEEYLEEDPSTTRTEMRWELADSPYHLEGDQFFGEVDRLFREHEEQRYSDVEVRFQAMMKALVELDEEGLFGRGSEREKVTLMVLIPGEQTTGDLVATIRRLNPKSVSSRVSAELEALE